MELRLDSRGLHQAVDDAARVFQNQRLVACCGDRFTLTCLCLMEPIRRSVVAAATTEDEGFDVVCAPGPAC